MKVGFTGTRFGMNQYQYNSYCDLVAKLKPKELHHGDCVGADDQSAIGIRSCIERGLLTDCKIICHPPLDESHRAFNKFHEEMREPKTHFARNRDIVDETEVLIACPKDTERQERGGTWYTYDYALKKGKTVYVIWPNGTVEKKET
jgi:hypothetical protein